MRSIIEFMLTCAPCVVLLACGGSLGSKEPADRDDAPEQSYEIRTRLDAAQALRGGDGGEPFSSLCPEQRVLIGIRAVGVEDLWGLGVHCAGLDLRGNAGVAAGYDVDVVPLDQLSMIGGNIDPAPPVVSYDCPPEMVVTAVSWSIHQIEGWATPVVKQMSLTCSELAVDSARTLTLGPNTATLDAGMTREGLEVFPQSCGASSVVSGFTGRSGAALDALSTQCVTLSVDAF